MKRLAIKFKTLITKESLLKIPMIPPALIFILLIIVTRPFVIIKIYRVHDWRFGHLVADSQIVSLETKEWNETHKKKMITIFYFGSEKSANEYFVKKLKENHFSIQKRFGFTIYYICKFVKFLITTTDENAADPRGLMLKYSPQVEFSSIETSVGERFLEKYKLNPESKFVCLVVRDPAYLNEERIGSKYAKHGLRNSSINSYRAAAETLAEAGYTVFRMGAKVKEPFDSPHPKVIDYATNGTRTEFLDLFLGARCTFSVVTDTGWALVPRIFGRPTIYVNSVPFLKLNQISTTVVLYPKLIIDESSNKALSLKELVQREAILQGNKYTFAKMGLRHEDLSSQDLVDAVIEMSDRTELRFQQSQTSKLFHDNLIREITNDPRIKFDKNKYPVRAEYASCFLAKHPILFE
jgi:putative glycosyltransferase (TIGR04372 family)